MARYVAVDEGNLLTTVHMTAAVRLRTAVTAAARGGMGCGVRVFRAA
jgi:hypothetical protein